MERSNERLSEYLRQISLRGDHYGNHGGLYSLLEWCGKNKIPDVTEEEARIFLEDPHAGPPAQTGTPEIKQ